MKEKAAILIVNGGIDPKNGRWLELCLENLHKYTKASNCHLYIWNNNVQDKWVDEFVNTFKNTTLLEADPEEKLRHLHAVPLQRLYELAIKDNPKYIITMDTDAFPIRSDWLEEMVRKLNDGYTLAGVWRDELGEGIQPYVHASCLCTTVDFIEKYKLRLDSIPKKTNIRHDTLSTFTDKALELGLKIFKLKRSNQNQLHSVIGGIYGDTIYHHGAGSRKYVHFWNEKYNLTSDHKNNRVKDIATALLFRHPKEYLNWLKNKNRSNLFLFILGMHRSGTSCLAGSLERCGLYMGDANRHSEYNVKGNYELKDIRLLNDQILRHNSGNWYEPPENISVSQMHKKKINEFVQDISAFAPCGIKDPRLLLMMDEWVKAVASPVFIGSFRHPTAAVKSLMKRDGLSENDSYNLWLQYNRKLVYLHKLHQFPIIEFDLSNPETYCYKVASLAVDFGLKPGIKEIREFVSESLDHSKNTENDKIPEDCRQIYQYLRENCYNTNFEQDSFKENLIQSYEALSNKITLRFKDKVEYGIYRLAGYIPKSVRRTIRKVSAYNKE